MGRFISVLCLVVIMPFRIFSEERSWNDLPKLSEHAYLSYSHAWDAKLRKTVLTVYAFENGNRKKLFNIAGLSSNRVQMTSDKRRLFYLIDDSDDENGIDDLWLFDGAKGNATILQKVAPDFVTSNDGQYLCYSDDRYINKIPWPDGRNFSQLSIPVIVVRDLYQRKDFELDLSDSALRDKWGIGTEFDYKPEERCFGIAFTYEAEILYRYRFELDSRKFFPEESETPIGAAHK